MAHPASRGAASTKLGKRHLPLFAGTSLLDQAQQLSTPLLLRQRVVWRSHSASSRSAGCHVTVASEALTVPVTLIHAHWIAADKWQELAMNPVVVLLSHCTHYCNLCILQEHWLSLLLLRLKRLLSP